MNVNGLTIREMSNTLKIGFHAIKARLRRLGIKPKEYAGQTGIYDYSALEAIKDTSKPGRPKK
jgi:hypothetical protein